MPTASLGEIRDCVKKTIDDCLNEILADRPSVRLTDRQHVDMLRLVDELTGLFFDIRNGSG